MPREVEAVLGDCDQRHAEQHAQDRAAAAAEPGTAQNRGGEHVELAADERVGHDLLDVMSLHQAGDPGADAEPAIGQ